MRKIRVLETAAFISAAIAVLYLGADHPVPGGFGLLVITVAVIAALQHGLLIWLHQNLLKRKTFLIAVLLSSVTALAAAGFLIARAGRFNEETLIWLLIIGAAAVVYGSLLWVLNRWLINRYRTDGKS
ncbi:MAG: hypothetical protein J5887_02785 [Erysipelotrichaceae bacterium]|nr:hypothetical protein [Erysipelotrichaceae bacterium]